MSLIAYIFGIMLLQFLDPILSLHMEDLGMKSDDTGFAFALFSLTWGVGSPVVGFVCQHINRRVVVCLSFIVVGVSLLLTGPSKAIGIAESMGIVLVGLALLGFGVSGCVVPLLPEIVDAINEEEKEKAGGEAKQNSQVADKAAALYNMSFALGAILGPPIGGAIDDARGFSFTCDIFALTSFAFAVIYLIAVVIPSYFCKR